MKKLLILAMLSGCSNLPTAHQAKVDFCSARAAYKVLAAAQNGAWDPVPGSPRAQLEAAEDALCATVSP